MNIKNPKVRVISTKEAKDINKTDVAYLTMTDGTVAVVKKDEQNNPQDNQKSSIYQKYKLKKNENNINNYTNINNANNNKRIEENRVIDTKYRNFLNSGKSYIYLIRMLRYKINLNNNINNNINKNNIHIPQINNKNINNINITSKQNYENKNIINRVYENRIITNRVNNNIENSKYQIIEAIPVKFCENPQIKNYSQPEPLYVEPYLNPNISEVEYYEDDYIPGNNNYVNNRNIALNQRKNY